MRLFPLGSILNGARRHLSLSSENVTLTVP
jgi:hypothetical protein